MIIVIYIFNFKKHCLRSIGNIYVNGFLEGDIIHLLNKKSHFK